MKQEMGEDNKMKRKLPQVSKNKAEESSYRIKLQ